MKTMRLLSLVLGLVLLTGLAAAAPPTTELEFDIPAQRLSDALNAFGRQTGLSVAFYDDAVANRESDALSGHFTAEAALGRLLVGSGLQYRFVNAKTIAIVRPGAETAGNQSGTATTLNDLGPAVPTAVLRIARNDQAPSSAENVDNKSAAKASAGDSEGKGNVQEIIVTATKREERLSDVPMSIGVVTADDIDRRGLVSGEDYLRGIPGVAQGGNGMYGDSIVIRGTETSRQGQNARTGSTVATYFGETPVTSSRGYWGGTGIDIKLVDIERVEVLRGPQGTSFGSGSIGGAVRTIPAAPKLDRFEAKMGVGYSQISGAGGDGNMIQGVGNFPLVQDKLALRVVAYRFEDSGYYKNVAGSDPAFQSAVVVPRSVQSIARNEDEVGGTRFLGGRASLLFQATDKLKFTLSYLKQNIEQDGSAVQTTAASGPYSQTVLQVAPEHQYRGETGATNDSNIDLANATIGYDLGWGDLLATYSHSDSKSRPVFAGGALGLDLSVNAGGSASPVSRQHANFSELRMTTKLDGAWNFLGGLYLEDIDDKAQYTYFWAGPASTVPSTFPGRYLGASNYVRNLKQKAAFAEASWKFLPRFTLTLGGRYYDYDRHGGDAGDGGFYTGSTVTSVKNEATGTTFRANLSYKPTDDSLVYASWSQGFRLGGASPGVAQTPLCDANSDGIVDGTDLSFAATRTTKSDEVDSYEIGSKVSLVDRRVNLTGAVYRMNWVDLPVSLQNPPTIPSTCVPFIYTANAGEARSEGAELQANFKITRGFSIDAGGSWNRARITKVAPTILASAGVVVGAKLPTPEYNGNLALQYEFGVGTSKASVRLDSTYVSSFFDRIIPTASTNLAGGYTQFDARGRVAFANNLNVDLFVRNLTNRDDYTFRGTRAFGTNFGYRLQPRTIGLQLGYTF